MTRTLLFEDVKRAKACSVETMQAKGYKLVKEWFVDSSGFGQEGEAALTIDQFQVEFDAFVAGYSKPLTPKITGQGAFQVYVGLFEKSGPKVSKVIANNTLLITLPGKRIIRLYDTDILTEENGTITITTGGFDTVTTRSRINDYLPAGYGVYVKNYQQYVTTPKGLKTELNTSVTIPGVLNV